MVREKAEYGMLGDPDSDRMTSLMSKIRPQRASLLCAHPVCCLDSSLSKQKCDAYGSDNDEVRRVRSCSRDPSSMRLLTRF